VFVSSGFRTAYGQDEIQVEEGDEHVTSKSDEGLGEAPPRPQEPGPQEPGPQEPVPQEPSENLQPEAGEQEVKGNLQADPDVHIRNELVDSAEVGEDDADKKDVDVETVPKEPETQHPPDNTRSGNLDLYYGKQSLYTFAGKNCV
jgi:hypothetical protein